MTTEDKNFPREGGDEIDFRMPEIALNSLDDAVLVCALDAPYTITFANSALSRIRGSRRRVTNAPFPRSHSPFPAVTEAGPSFVRLFASPPERKTWDGVMTELRTTGRSVNCRLILRPGDRADPHPVPVDVRMTPVHRSDGNITQFIAVLRDIRPLLYAEKERADIARNLDCVIAELSNRALHDNLTGLPNRFYFHQKIDGVFSGASKRGKRVGFVLVDLDNFKEVNDTLGHTAGDTVLLRVVEAFRKRIRPGEFIVRWGGDEFLWIVPGLENEAELIARFPEIIGDVVAEGRPDASVSGVTASIGHAIWPDDGATADELVGLADYAMYRVKASGKNGWYDSRFPGDTDEARRVPPSVIFRKLGDAVASGSIGARYTPVCDLTTGDPVSLVCRLRWTDAEAGEISAEEFFPYVERKGLLGSFVYAMIDGALSELAPAMRARPTLGVTLDLSLPLLTDPTLIARLGDICASRGVPPGRVTLRIVERKPFLDRPGCRERMAALAAAGFRFSLAHFASGAMSTDTFLGLKFDELTVDGFIVGNIGTPRGDWMLGGVADLARRTGATVVLDGVDETATSDRLRDLGFRYGAGALFGREMTFAELDAKFPPRSGSDA